MKDLSHLAKGALRDIAQGKLSVNHFGAPRGRIQLPPYSSGAWARTEWVLLHELAHCVHARQLGSAQQQWHGKEFCKIYRELVRKCISEDAKRALGEAFRKHNVDF